MDSGKPYLAGNLLAIDCLADSDQVQSNRLDGCRVPIPGNDTDPNDVLRLEFARNHRRTNSIHRTRGSPTFGGDCGR